MAGSCQQSMVYAAERRIDQGRTFDSLHAVQVFVDELRETWWWERHLENVLRVEVGPARAGGDNVGWFESFKHAGRMEFATCRPSMQLVTHELSHVLADARRFSRSHDPWFARVYLELTYLLMGSDAYLALRESFIAGEVDFDAAGIMDWERTSR